MGEGKGLRGPAPTEPPPRGQTDSPAALALQRGPRNRPHPWEPRKGARGRGGSFCPQPHRRLGHICQLRSGSGGAWVEAGAACPAGVGAGPRGSRLARPSGGPVTQTVQCDLLSLPGPGMGSAVAEAGAVPTLKEATWPLSGPACPVTGLTKQTRHCSQVFVRSHCRGRRAGSPLKTRSGRTRMRSPMAPTVCGPHAALSSK